MIKEDCEIFIFDDCFKKNGILIDRDHLLGACKGRDGK